MDDYSGFDSSDSNSSGKFYSNWPPFVLAALIFTIPFIIVDFFNYFSAGTALAISTPILAILYASCGAVAAKLAAGRGGYSQNDLVTGALSGVLMWLASTVVNTIISLIVGTALLGTTLLLGIPYLCLCAPIQLIGGAMMGGLGGFIYSLFLKNSSASTDEDYYG